MSVFEELGAVDAIKPSAFVSIRQHTPAYVFEELVPVNAIEDVPAPSRILLILVPPELGEGFVVLSDHLVHLLV